MDVSRGGVSCVSTSDSLAKSSEFSLASSVLASCDSLNPNHCSLHLTVSLRKCNCHIHMFFDVASRSKQADFCWEMHAAPSEHVNRSSFFSRIAGHCLSRVTGWRLRALRSSHSFCPSPSDAARSHCHRPVSRTTSSFMSPSFFGDLTMRLVHVSAFQMHPLHPVWTSQLASCSDDPVAFPLGLTTLLLSILCACHEPTLSKR